MVVAFAAVGTANAGKPKSGDWFSIDETPDDSDLSSIQFKVPGNGKTIKKLTIYWKCKDKPSYHEFRNPPIPIGINKKGKFKIYGATQPPSGQPQKDFELKGKFISKKLAKYSMELERCGGKQKGKIEFVDN